VPRLQAAQRNGVSIVRSATAPDRPRLPRGHYFRAPKRYSLADAAEKIAIGDIVEANVAEDVASSLLCRDVLHLAPDNNGKFGFPIQLDASIGTAADRIERPGKREHRLKEKLGSVGVGTFISSMCFL
jgi:hypothetical protein